MEKSETEIDQRNIDDMNAVLEQVIGFFSGSLFRFDFFCFYDPRQQGLKFFLANQKCPGEM